MEQLIYVNSYWLGIDTDDLGNRADEEYEEEIVEFLLKVEETVIDEE